MYGHRRLGRTVATGRGDSPGTGDKTSRFSDDYRDLGSSTLTWLASDAEECTASGGWHGPLATSGTWSTGKLSNTTEYELTCTGQWGSATQSVTVTVTEQSPAVTLQASPSSLHSGDSSTLTWSSQNATSCIRLRRVVRQQGRQRLPIDGGGQGTRSIR